MNQLRPQGECHILLCLFRLHVTSSRLVRLSHPDGVVKWTATIDGTISGAPEISGNGDYVFITAVALDGPFAPVGVFMILRADDGSEFYREDVAGLPFGPPGLYANPTLGFYPGGEANRNDLVMFACSFITNVAVPSNGCLYVFQFPVGFSGASTNGLQLQRLGSPGWVTNIKPTLFLNGLSMYWSVSRAQVKGWYGDDINEISFRFQRVARYSAQFLRGNPTASTPNSRPVLNANEDTIFLAGAAAEMHSLNIDLTTRWTTPSVAPIVVDPVITPDGQAMFWAEDFGRVHGASTADGVDIWQSIVPGHTFSEMDMDSTGSRLYFGNGFGNLFGWTVATGATPNPISPPTMAPTLAPTSMPTGAPVPTASPTSGEPTFAPSPVPTPPPTSPFPTITPTTPMPTPAPNTQSPSVSADAGQPQAQPQAQPTNAPATSSASSYMVGTLTLMIAMAGVVALF